MSFSIGFDPIKFKSLQSFLLKLSLLNRYFVKKIRRLVIPFDPVQSLNPFYITFKVA